jgi:hypothetical protein
MPTLKQDPSDFASNLLNAESDPYSGVEDFAYSQGVDSLIYSNSTRSPEWTPQDWLILALAAADQGGLSAKDQERIRDVFVSAKPEVFGKP